jgi:hypothetical protein
MSGIAVRRTVVDYLKAAKPDQPRVYGPFSAFVRESEFSLRFSGVKRD